MNIMYGNIAALAVVMIYYIWRTYFQAGLCRERTLRRRVAFMLWVMASPDRRGAGSYDDYPEEELFRDVSVSV